MRMDDANANTLPFPAPSPARQMWQELTNIPKIPPVALLSTSMISTRNRHPTLSPAPQMWLELADIITRHPEQVAADLRVDAILRGGIRKFSDEVGRLPYVYASLARLVYMCVRALHSCLTCRVYRVTSILRGGIRRFCDEVGRPRALQCVPGMWRCTSGCCSAFRRNAARPKLTPFADACNGILCPCNGIRTRPHDD